MTEENHNLLMDLEPLLDAVFSECKCEQMPVYIWFSIDGSKYSWAVSSNRHNHVEEPIFMYSCNMNSGEVVRLVE